MAFWHYPSQLSVSSFWGSTPLAFKQSSTRIHDGNPSVRKGSGWETYGFVCLCLFVCVTFLFAGRVWPYFFPNTCIAWRGAVAVLVSFCQTWLVFFPQPNTCAKSLPTHNCSFKREHLHSIHTYATYACFARKKKGSEHVSGYKFHLSASTAWSAPESPFGRFVWGAPVEV